MKILFFTDSHIRGTSPRNRKDNFYETLKRKFEDVARIAAIEKVDYILHGGDWFDRPDISPSIVREFAIAIKAFEKPIYTIAGNHDLYGQNPDTLERTMLGIIEGIGLIKLLRYDDVVILEKDGIRVQLTGRSYIYDIDGENYRKYYIVEKRKDVDYAINMIHGMLLKKPFPEGIPFTLISDITDTGADITLSGHYHSGFGIVKAEGKYFVNPGSIVRVTNYKSELERVPKVVIIELDGWIELKEIQLESALPGEEVLDREKLEKEKSKEQKLQEFYRDIAVTEGFEKVDIDEIIKKIAEKQDLPGDVREEAIRRIGKARENNTVNEDDL